MFDPVMALAVLALLALAYIVGMALAVVSGAVWDWLRGRG